MAQKGGNRFAADRSSDFPLPAQKNTYSAQLFESGAGGGLSPIQPAVRQHLGLLHPYGAQMGPCNFCGFAAATPATCIRFAERQHSAGAAHGKTLRATHQRQRAEGQPDRRQVPRHRRELRRCAGPRD